MQANKLVLQQSLQSQCTGYVNEAVQRMRRVSSNRTWCPVSTFSGWSRSDASALTNECGGT